MDKPLNPDAVLVDRAPAIFRNIVRGGLSQLETPEGKVLLELPTGYKRKLNTVCGRCAAAVRIAFKHCDRCGELNAEYGEAQAIIHGRASAKRHKQGSSTDVTNVMDSVPTETRDKTKKIMGDLLASFRHHAHPPEPLEPPPLPAPNVPPPEPLDDGKDECNYILYTIDYILYTIFYILYNIFYILYTIYYILYTISYLSYPIS